MLKSLITSKVKRKILSLLFINPENEFYLREISKKLDEETNAVSRELKILEDGGIVLSHRKGNMKYFAVNRKCPIFNELKNIILKTDGLGSIIKNKLKDSNILFAFIYGSYAEGREGRKSDIDLMVIGEIRMNRFNRMISNLERNIGRDINYIIYPKREFLEKSPSGFIQKVIKDKKIMIIGEEDEFKRFVKKR